MLSSCLGGEDMSDSFWCVFYMGDGNEGGIRGGYILAGLWLGGLWWFFD